jgi:GTP-binding protein
MKITSAKFIKGLVENNDILEKDKPHIAFIGRSNAGKSSVINSLSGQKSLVRTSSSPGRTREINLFLINKKFIFADLPGYGFTDSKTGGERLGNLIYWYLFNSDHKQEKVIVIVDAEVFPTDSDMEMIRALMDHKKYFTIVANKIDKIKPSQLNNQIKKIRDAVWPHKVIPYSAKNKIGVKELLTEIA